MADMNDATAAACGFATQAQQRRMKEIFEALAVAAVARGSGNSIVENAFERTFTSTSLRLTISQDAHRVSMYHPNGLTMYWKYDGTFQAHNLVTVPLGDLETFTEIMGAALVIPCNQVAEAKQIIGPDLDASLADLGSDR